MYRHPSIPGPVYHELYALLQELGITRLLERGCEGTRCDVGGAVELSFDRLYVIDSSTVIALAETNRENVEVWEGVDMEIRICHASRSAEALSLRTGESTDMQEVYPTIDTVDYALRETLNKQLHEWLGARLAQGFHFGACL